MGRIFRMWEKKRGHRRTGSPLAGGVGEALFFGLVFLVGSSVLAAVVTLLALDPTSSVYRPGFGFWVTVLVLTSFVVIGGGGLLRSVLQLGVSVERRSALARRAAGIDLIRDSMRSSQDYPTIPRDAHLTNSPGVQLAFRLPLAQPSMWKFWFATSFALVCSVVTCVLLVVAINGHLWGQPEWFLTLYLVPQVVVNAWGVRLFLREVWVHARIGPTCVEISDHPLRPDREYAIFLCQAGRLSLRCLEMSLVCEEEATFRQGTDIRKEMRTVRELPVFARHEIRVTAGAPLGLQETLRVPADAMHSFQSAHNGVQWRLVLKGEAESGVSFVRRFPVIVYPPVCDATRP